MMYEDIMAQLTEVFRRVFGDDALVITPATSSADIKGWDSFRMVSLVLAVEQAFGLRFRSREVDKLRSVGDFADLIHTKSATS